MGPGIFGGRMDRHATRGRSGESVGRHRKHGTRLSRSDRVKIWTVFEEYRNGLNRKRKREVDDAYRDAAALLKSEPQRQPYCALVVDEAQDMSTQAFKLIRQIIPEGPNDIFVVGDGHQRIYGRNKVVLSHCDINIRGRSKKLRVNYRTTEEIRRSAVNLLEGFPVDDLDGGSDTNEGYKSLSHGEVPTMRSFGSAEEQARFIADLLKAKQDNSERLGDVCVVARIKKELDVIEDILKDSGVSVVRVTAEKSDHARDESVRLATMHRVKGLEFEDVVLASVNEGLVPFELALSGKGDSVEQRQADMEERALLYVAMTRAKSGVIVLSYGEPSRNI